MIFLRVRIGSNIKGGGSNLKTKDRTWRPVVNFLDLLMIKKNKTKNYSFNTNNSKVLHNFFFFKPTFPPYF